MGDQTLTPINLLRGWPNPSLLPVSLLAAAAQTALSNPTVAHDALLYGPDPGYEPARVAFAAWLTSFYRPRMPIGAERLCITGGASQNLGNLLSVYTDPTYTKNVWIVVPAYFLAFCIFEDAGFAGKMRAVPEDDDGLDIEYLEREMEASQREGVEESHQNGSRYKPQRKIYQHVIYCVPSFSNPSSRSMSLARRVGLVRLARKFDALVVADDVYDFIQWRADGVERSVLTTAHLPRLVDLDRELDGGAERKGADEFGNACSNGSFSKIAGPGIRCGWVEGTKKFAYAVSQTGTTRSGGAPSQLASTYVTHLVATGQLQHHIQSVLCPAYTQRYAKLIAAISAHLLPLGFTLPQPDREVVGGYFVWLGLPSGLKAVDLARVCREEEAVVIAAGAMFEVPGDANVAFPGHVRICFAWEEEERLREGIARVGKVAGSLLARSSEKAKSDYESGKCAREDEMGTDAFK